MKNQPLAFFLVLTVKSVVFAYCPIGATQGTAPDDCYFLISSPASWYEAEEVCIERGGHLPSVTNAFTNAFLQQQGSERWQRDFWLGARETTAYGKWGWADGATFNYTRWASGKLS